jgi:hypothetical protein
MTGEGVTETAAAETLPSTEHRSSYRSALRAYSNAELVRILQAHGREAESTRSAALVDAILETLSNSRTVQRALDSLTPGSRIAASLFALTELPSLQAAAMALSLRCLGIEPLSALSPLLDVGLLAPEDRFERGKLLPLAELLSGEIASRFDICAHPAVLSLARTLPPEAEGPAADTGKAQIREADGLEPCLRLAALWQLVDAAPLRHTQQGPLYKKDRERLEEDPALACPLPDMLAPIPDAALLWLELAKEIGLVVQETGTDRLLAAPAAFWDENAVHVPQMIATRWLGLRGWHERKGSLSEVEQSADVLGCLRPVILLWLALYADDRWLSIAALAAHFDRLAPGWAQHEAPAAEFTRPEVKNKRGRVAQKETEASPGEALLRSILLGPAYQLGLVRCREAAGSAAYAQLTSFGRYVLALGPAPAARDSFEHFLFVQPNFEVIAYRQGLTPALIGQFSRFARWMKLGAAVELRLTAETTYRALEGGLKPEAILKRLERHSARPLPPGIAEAFKTWAGRREQVTYHASATLIEFASADARTAALEEWPTDAGRAPTPIGDRLLLVEDERAIPFHRFRLTGSRDYRRPPEACVHVEPDGVTLTLDTTRSDLFIEAELARIAGDPLPAERTWLASLPSRRYHVTRASLERAVDDGITVASLTRWFQKRAGSEIPAATRLLLHAIQSRGTTLHATRPLILTAPAPELIDGLLQHPATRDYFGERLGDRTIVVIEAGLTGLREALARFGLSLDIRSR